MSNVPDDKVPAWVLHKRERARDEPRRRAFHKKDWERICREVDALKEESK